MATVFSDQLTKVRAGRNLPPNQNAGKVRIAVWDFASLPVGNLGDVLVCFKLEKDERVILGREFHSALSSGAGTATGSYGTHSVGVDGVSLGAADSAARFLAATSFEAAGQNGLADLQALGIGLDGGAGGVLFASNGNAAVAAGTGQDFFVTITNSGEAFATAGRISGWALVVKD